MLYLIFWLTFYSNLSVAETKNVTFAIKYVYFFNTKKNDVSI